MSKKRTAKTPAGVRTHKTEVKKRYHVRVSVPHGNGQHEVEEADIVGFEADAQAALWDMLNNMGVETSYEEVE